MCVWAPCGGGAFRGAVTPEPVGGRHWKSQNRRPAPSRIIYALLASRWSLRFKNIIIFPPIFVHKILRVSYVAVATHDILFPRQRGRRRRRRIPLSPPPHPSQTPPTSGVVYAQSVLG